jgi:hypothetical protein
MSAVSRCPCPYPGLLASSELENAFPIFPITGPLTLLHPNLRCRRLGLCLCRRLFILLHGPDLQGIRVRTYQEEYQTSLTLIILDDASSV